MGPCTSAHRGPACNKLLLTEPEDIEQFDPASSHLHEFEGNLSNVKIQNLPEGFKDKLKANFKIIDLVDITCPLQLAHDRRVKWKINASFSFAHNDYQIRTKYLRVGVCDSSKKTLFSLKINLFGILTGPYHHDFKIRNGQKTMGRLIFDLRISQIVNIKIESTNTQIDFCRQHPGQKFQYLLESYTADANKNFKNKSVFKTAPSYTKEVPIEEQMSIRPITEQDEAPSPTTRLRRTGCSLIKESSKSALTWDTEQKNKMPGLQLKVRSHNILSCSLGFKLYRFTNDNKKMEYGKYGISFSEILSAIPFSRKEATGEHIQIRDVVVEKTIQEKGKEVGECKTRLLVTTHPFYRQTNSQSQTEDGIVNMDNFLKYQVMESKDNRKQEQLQKIYKKALEVTESEHSKSRRYIVTLTDHLTSLLHEVTNTSRGSFVYYKQQSTRLQHKKILLINILKLASSIIEEADIQISELCWNIVIQVIKRGQFMLANWAFSDQEVEILMKKREGKDLAVKVNLSYMLWEIFITLLRQSFDVSLSKVNQNEHEEIFKVFSFFRQPLFRKTVLNSLLATKSSGGTTLDSLSTQAQDISKSERQTLDWEATFYSVLVRREKGSVLKRHLQQVLECEESQSWLCELAKQGQMFFDFCRLLLGKVSQIRKVYDYLDWQCFEGYKEITQCMLTALKNRPLSEWTYELILSSVSLLQNPKMFPRVLQFLYQKTNVHDSTLVKHMLYILSHFLNKLMCNRSLQKLNSKDELQFPYLYFVRGIKTILETSQNHITLRLTLIFLFKFYGEFEQSFRYELSKYLLGAMFWKLFYFWSYDVRDVFYHFFILKICQDADLLATTDISQSVDTCFKVIANGQFFTLVTNSARSKTTNEVAQSIRRKLNKRKRHKAMCQGENKQLRLCELISQEPLRKINIKLYQIQMQLEEDCQLPPPILMKKQFSYKIDGIEPKDITLKRLKKKISLMPTFFEESLIQYGFTEAQLTLNEINWHIEPYLVASVKRFKEIAQLVDSYYDQHGILPQMQQKLNVFGTKIDRKEIAPEFFYQDIFD